MGACGVAASAWLWASGVAGAGAREVLWKHLSSRTGDIEAPNAGRQQCTATVFDVDRDGVNDFVISERTEAPSVVWYRRGPKGWTKHVVEPQHLQVEAGATFLDVDGDGDLDFVGGGDYSSNEIWWWENPFPAFDPQTPWTRHTIKRSGGPKHHDMLFGDFDGDGRLELAFWNQGSNGLFVADVPADPRGAAEWPYRAVYTYSIDSEAQQRCTAEPFKGVNEHEGLAAADVDGDGVLDIVGGGRWFRHLPDGRWAENLVDPAYTFTRAAVGRLLKDSARPQIVLVVGDGRGPMMWYEWVKGTWVPHAVIAVDSGHSLQLVDFDGDGNLDIFSAEMRLGGRDPDARLQVLLGDGQGRFEPMVIARGIGLHESKMADLDGNGTLDVLGKPYDFDTPRLDVWLNMGGAR